MRKISLAGATAALALGTGVLAPVLVAAPAEAATGTCSGKRIEHLPIRETSGSKSVLGHLDIYYNSRTGKNCVRTVALSKYSGFRKDMGTGIRTCSRPHRSKCYRPSKASAETGLFKRYAGPKYIYGRGKCIQAAAYISWGKRQAHRMTPSFHCG